MLAHVPPGGGEGCHLVHFKNDMWHNIGRLHSLNIKFTNEFQIMKVPLKIDISFTSMIDRYKIWAIPFCKNNIRDENKDPRIYV